MAPIPVVAAVIERAGMFLICRRPAEKRHGGLWEFPGGKLLNGETPLEGARRELAEELALEVQSIGTPIAEFQDPGSDFVIMFCPVEATGEPHALEHSELRWVGSKALLGFNLAPTDLRFAQVLVDSGG